MTRYNFKGFYGAYGHILVNNDGTAKVEIIWNTCIHTPKFTKKYKSLKGAKIALSRMLDSYTLTECKGGF